MVVSLANLLIKGSIPAPSGQVGNSSPNGGPGTNLGGFCSSGTLVDATVDNLFPDATGIENAEGNQDYQLYFLHNNDAQDLSNGTVFLQGDVPGGAIDAIALDPTGPTPLASAAQQALIIANKNTAPAGVVFSSPVTAVSGLAFPVLLHGYVLPIWLRRTCQGGAAVNNDGVIIGYAATSPL